jgi:hypothetical protein
MHIAQLARKDLKAAQIIALHLTALYLHNTESTHPYTQGNKICPYPRQESKYGIKNM